MITQTAKVKNGQIKIALPKELRRSWREAEVFVFPTEDTLIVKKFYQSPRIFNEEAEKKLRALGKKITKKDIDEAIAWARKKKR